MREQSDQQKELIAQAVELLKPIVKKIEDSPPVTKNHYGVYMQTLSYSATEADKRKMAACLILAGANKEGVEAALKLSL